MTIPLNNVQILPNFNFPLLQNLILAKYFNLFLHFLFLIKSTKKFNFKPKLKDQKIKLVSESSFLYYWKRNELYHDTS